MHSRHRLARVVVGAAAICLLTTPRDAGGDPYADLPASAYDVYDATLTYARESNFTGLAKSMKYMRGLLRAMSRDCGVDLEEELNAAIARRDSGGARTTLLRLIGADLRRLLAEAVVASGSARRDLVQVAFAVYGLVSSAVPESSDAEIRAAFKQLYKADDAAVARDRARSIGDRLVPALPRCSRARGNGAP